MKQSHADTIPRRERDEVARSRLVRRTGVSVYQDAAGGSCMIDGHAIRLETVGIEANA